MRGEAYKLYTDKGYSGKNTDRPQFQEMMQGIISGEISQVIVYKLDRISRSILDFSSMMEQFQKYHVEFVSSTEKFDTSTPMGRAMLNICIVFAQLERETIQKRVADAYFSRSKRGFYMGGRIPYGYRLVDTVMDGVKTAMYVMEPEEAEHVKLIYELYANPQTSFGDIVRYLQEHEIINTHTGVWNRTRIANMIKNPVYARADLDIYEFYKNQGTVINNDPSDFIGINGCYLYSGADAGRKELHLKGQTLVLAPHEGIVDSLVWIKARIKCVNNKQVSKPLKASNTWLAGKIKCGRCGYALISKKSNAKYKRYFICSRKMQSLSCEGAGTITADEFENMIFEEMKRKLKDFKVLSKKLVNRVNPKIAELNIQLKQVDVEIETLLDKLTSANEVLMTYINSRISELDSKKNLIQKEISALSPINIPTDIKGISNYLERWETVSFEDKRMVVDTLIEVIHATEDSAQIKWHI